MPKAVIGKGGLGMGLAVLAVAFSGVALGQEGSPRLLYGEGTPRFLTIPPNFVRPAGEAASTAATTIPTWTGSFTFAGVTLPYTMVGTNPAAGSQLTVVPTVIIPLKFVFADGTVLDPTAPAFGSSQSAVQSTVMSPIFKGAPFSAGGVGLGTTQYVDAFQRANFWSQVSTTSPGYHVLLSQPYVLPSAIPVNVPALYGSTVSGPGARIGQVGINFFNFWLAVVVPRLTFVPHTAVLVFLTYNTFFTQQGGCCVLGFHTAFGASQATALTVAVAAYNDAGVFNVPIEDIHALSHEVGEWMDDPFGNNLVPGWSAGQAAGTCQHNLEVGDPVTGIAFPVTLNGMTYHPEDLVFLSWFARQVPSTAVNGWYSFLNSFASPPPVCR